ncbi:DoxX family protein [Segnochrobactrum spirostomi]|uniref:DoxX family protein n=1 Tax=Segnochrobactrum spirostomi TaxID=2608987 RepID=A0A6A7Y557_9HYPH|nr:DoxX family protein [Segnochrobactrum spirostomi]MQT14323.1 DoxX family protein [Segnochrobactrum spirostomi]
MAAQQSRLSRYAPYMLGILRFITGLLFLEHGSSKLFGFPHSPMFDGLQIVSVFGIGGILELCGGILILLGAFTRIVAFVLAGEMAFAYWMFHFPQSPFPALNQGDAAILFCFIFLYLVFAGPGAFSLDGQRKA